MTCFEASASMKYCFLNFWLTRPKPDYDWQGLAGGIVGPGYSSKGIYFGVLQCLALRLRRSAQIGYSWGSDDYWCLTGIPTDQAGWGGQFMEVLIFLDTQTKHTLSLLTL